MPMNRVYLYATGVAVLFAIAMAINGYINWLHGHDLVLYCDQLPDQIEIKIDFTNGETPEWKDRGTRLKSFGIHLDEKGRGSIDSTAPFDNWHLKYIKVPNAMLREGDDFHLKRLLTVRPSKTVVIPSGGVRSWSVVDGTVYRWKVSPKPFEN